MPLVAPHAALLEALVLSLVAPWVTVVFAVVPLGLPSARSTSNSRFSLRHLRVGGPGGSRGPRARLTSLPSAEVAVVAVALFGAANGFCDSLSLVVINEIPYLSHHTTHGMAGGLGSRGWGWGGATGS